MGTIYHRKLADEAKFHIRFKGIEVYYEYDRIQDFIRDWIDRDIWLQLLDEETERERRKNYKKMIEGKMPMEKKNESSK